jgi:hypothetical protein
MTSACASPIPAAQLVDYWTADLDEPTAAGVEEHLFACTTCTAQMERIQRVIGAFRAGLAPVISPAQLADLRSSGLVIEESSFAPGQKQEARFAPNLDLLIFHLGGLALADAEQVSVTVRSEANGVIHEDPIAPFDRDRGEVLVACQKHFAAFPRDIVFDVRVQRPGRAADVASYAVPHVFL